MPLLKRTHTHLARTYTHTHAIEINSNLGQWSIPVKTRKAKQNQKIQQFASHLAAESKQPKLPEAKQQG